MGRSARLPEYPFGRRPDPDPAAEAARVRIGRPARELPAPDCASGQAELLRRLGAATRTVARGADPDEIVGCLCRSLVPEFGDAVAVYLRDPLPVDGARAGDPAPLRLRRADQGCPGVPVEPSASLETVLGGGRPLFADTREAASALARLAAGEAVVGRRAVLAPLVGLNRTIGAVVLLRRPPRPAFGPTDLLVAEQLAGTAALGIDKALRHGREAQIADQLQRAMLPDSLPALPGLQLASRYLPAGETAQVGGDWYDAIPLPGNRVALVVGDVMGHSLQSAAIMGQLRTTVQTLAGLGLPPEEVLHHLDEQAQRLGHDRMATCVYAVYDPVAHRLMVANAGHPPPVLLHADGTAEVLRVPEGAPIGVGGVPFETVELPAPPGSVLLLYTDGLVESRARDAWSGIEELTARLGGLAARGTPPLERLCDQVLHSLAPGARDDDIALLATRFVGIAPGDVAYWFLDPRPQTPAKARRLTRQALARWQLDDLVDTADLLVSEVMTNAVRHAKRPVTLRLLRTDVLRCEVGDDAPQLPRLRHAEPDEENGRGLLLVQRLSQRWGATRANEGKVVWFELPLPARQQG